LKRPSLSIASWKEPSSGEALFLLLRQVAQARGHFGDFNEEPGAHLVAVEGDAFNEAGCLLEPALALKLRRLRFLCPELVTDGNSFLDRRPERGQLRGRVLGVGKVRGKMLERVQRGREAPV
jgi:hypothetical protein